MFIVAEMIQESHFYYMFYVYVALYVYQIFTGILQVFFNFVIYMFLFLNYLILNLCGNIVYSLYI